MSPKILLISLKIESIEILNIILNEVLNQIEKIEKNFLSAKLEKRINESKFINDIIELKKESKIYESYFLTYKYTFDLFSLDSILKFKKEYIWNTKTNYLEKNMKIIDKSININYKKIELSEEQIIEFSKGIKENCLYFYTIEIETLI